MNYDELAAKVHDDPDKPDSYYCRHGLGWVNGPCVECIAAAIRDAVLAEREACARIADKEAWAHVSSAVPAERACHQVAADIRTRGNQEAP